MDFNSTVKFGTVVWTALSAVDDDNTDTNRDPNSKPVSNVRVTFTASTPRIVIQDPSPATIFLQSIDARTNEHGVLVGSDGAEGIKLVASDNVKASPVNFTYRVNISGLGVPIMFDISVPSDGVVDLSFLVPIVSSAGKVLAPERGPQGDPGPPPELAIGSVKSSAGSAEANLRPNPAGGHFLDLGLPLGPRGPQGDPGGITRPEVMSTTADLNSFVKDGRYSIENGTGLVNIPPELTQQYGTLDVISTNSPTRLTQLFYPTGSSQAGKIYWIRTFVGNVWSEWAAIRPSNSGGLTTPDLLGTTDLNTIYKDGVYRQNMGSYSTLERNYPAQNVAGILTVKSMSVNYISQTYDHINGNLKGPRVISKRFSVESKWSEWRTYASQRVDYTAGRAIYTWDDVSNREQLIYGDTGTRSILLPDTTDQYIYIRRVGSIVELHATGLRPNVVGNASYAGLIPVGFRPPAYRNFETSPYWSSEDSRKWRAVTNGNLEFLTLLVDDILNIDSTWTTHEAWPTALPGSSWAGPT